MSNHTRLRTTASLIALMIWIFQLLDILSPVKPYLHATIIAFLIFLVITIRQVTRTTWTVVIMCSLVTACALLNGGALSAIPRALQTVLLFMGFFPAVSLISIMFRQSGALDNIATSILKMPPSNRRASSLVVAHATGAVMNIGAMATISLSFNLVKEQAEREKIGLHAIRGVGLAFLWTPFTVGMGFATTQVPEVPLWLGMGSGFLAAVVGLALSLREWRPARLAMTFSLIRHVAFPICISAFALIVIDLLTGLSGIRAIILFTPPVAIIWLLMQGWAATVAAGRNVWAEIGLLGNTMWLFAASITMGTVLSETPFFLDVLGHLGLAAFSSPVIFATIAFTSVGLAVVGFHPTVIGSVLVALTAGVDGRLEPLAVFMLIIFGWHCGVILSVSSLSVAIVQRDFEIPLARLVVGQNLIFALACCGLMSIVYLLWTMINY